MKGGLRGIPDWALLCKDLCGDTCVKGLAGQLLGG